MWAASPASCAGKPPPWPRWSWTAPCCRCWRRPWRAQATSGLSTPTSSSWTSPPYWKSFFPASRRWCAPTSPTTSLPPPCGSWWTQAALRPLPLWCRRRWPSALPPLPAAGTTARFPSTCSTIRSRKFSSTFRRTASCPAQR